MGCFWECSIMFLEFQVTIWFVNFTPELLLRRCWKALISLEGITYICQECPSGSFQVSGASVSCSPCPTGSYQNETGSLACNRCPVGQYQDEEGQRDCKLCPAGATTLLLGSNSILDCGCKAGSINVATVAANVTTKPLECIPCREGFDCPFSSSVQALLTGLGIKLEVDWHPACHLHLVGFSGHFQWFKDYSRFIEGLTNIYQLYQTALETWSRYVEALWHETAFWNSGLWRTAFVKWTTRYLYASCALQTVTAHQSQCV